MVHQRRGRGQNLWLKTEHVGTFGPSEVGTGARESFYQNTRFHHAPLLLLFVLKEEAESVALSVLLRRPGLLMVGWVNKWAHGWQETLQINLDSGVVPVPSWVAWGTQEVVWFMSLSTQYLAQEWRHGGCGSVVFTYPGDKWVRESA